jgi:hypothetical protein
VPSGPGPPTAHRRGQGGSNSLDTRCQGGRCVVCGGGGGGDLFPLLVVEPLFQGQHHIARVRIHPRPAPAPPALKLWDLNRRLTTQTPPPTSERRCCVLPQKLRRCCIWR